MTGETGVSRRRSSISAFVAGVALLGWGALWIRSPTNLPRTVPPVDTVLVAASAYVWVPALGVFGIVLGSVPALRRAVGQGQLWRVGIAALGVALVGVGAFFTVISLDSVAGAVYVSPLIGAGAVAIWVCLPDFPAIRG